MARLIPLDGSSGGQILRAALTLAAVTRQGFEIRKIRARRPRPGLRPQHLAAVRAAAMACNAKVSGAFEGSTDLRFEPSAIAAGRFRFEIETAGAVTLVLQTVLPALATANASSFVEVAGGTHVPASPSFCYLERHWAEVVRRAGLLVTPKLETAGFYPRGGGEAAAGVEAWERRAELRLDKRGALLEVRGVSGAAKIKGGVAERQRDAAQARLWEARRIEAAWDVPELKAGSPGSFMLLEAVFEHGRLALGLLGQKGVRAENLGDRAGRLLLKLLDGEGAVDQHLADQLAVPMALSRQGGLVTTDVVTLHLETVASVLGAFAVPARTWGARGAPGGLEVGRY
jgi:RNA 3'-terminal phosphate cyclase (ATP)